MNQLLKALPAFAFVFAAACKKEAPAAPSGPAKLVPVEITTESLSGLTIQAPEGTEVKKAMVGGGAQLTQSSENFSISIREREFNAENSHIANTALDDKGTYVVDQPDQVIFQRASGALTFSMGVTVGARKFTCGSVTTAKDFTRPMIDAAMASCKSLAAK